MLSIYLEGSLLRDIMLEIALDKNNKWLGPYYVKVENVLVHVLLRSANR